MEVLNFSYVKVKSTKTVYKEDPDSSYIEPATEIVLQLGDIAPDQLALLHRLSKDGNLQVDFKPRQATLKDALDEAVDEVNNGALDGDGMTVRAEVMEPANR